MEFGFLILKLLLSFSKWITYPFRRLIWRNNVGVSISPIKDPLFFYSATKLAEMIRNRKIKSEIAIKAYVNGIKTVNKMLNAVLEDRFQQAIEEAKSIDLYLDQLESDLLQSLALTKPLMGVPVTIKESCALKGMSLAVGFTFLKGTKSKEDCVAVANLKAAGAIPLLVSTISELCLSINSENLITGTTCNPYNTNYTSGGSSGGEGALLGSGSSIIGIGSDLGGSTRIPAMFNCIFAHKPTSRVVSVEGHFPSPDDANFRNYATIGPLVRYAEDLRLMMKALSNTKKLNFDKNVDLNNTKLYFMEDLGFYIGISSVQMEIKQAIRNAVNCLHKTCGMEVHQEQFKELRDTIESSLCLLADLNDVIDIYKDPNHPDVKHCASEQLFKYVFSKSDVNAVNIFGYFSVVQHHCFIPKSQVSKHYKRVAALKGRIVSALGNNGILIMPTFPTSAFRHHETLWNLSNGAAFNLIWNILGFPSTQVPLGFDNNGMPIGLQVISTPYQDNLCIAVAIELEKHFGGWRPPFQERISKN